MRDIDATIKARALSKHQTVQENNAHSMEIIVSRPRTAIVHQRYWQESIVTAGATAVCTSVAIKRTGRWGETVYVAYVDSTGLLTVKSAPLRFPIREMSWTTVTTIAGCAACALEFEGSFVQVGRHIEFRTESTPWLFYTTTSGELKAGILGGSYESLVGANVTALDAIRGVASKYHDIDQGLIVFYAISGSVYYRQRIDGAWLDQEAVSMAPANAVSIRAERTFDYRIVLQVMDNTGALYEVFTKMEASSWNSAEYMQLTGASIVSTEIGNVYYTDLQTEETLVLHSVGIPDMWLMADFSPIMLSAKNMPVDKYNEDEELYSDWGYLVEFEVSQVLRNATLYPEDFILEDDNGIIWYGQEVTVSDKYSRKFLVSFNNFNNAVSPISARLSAGNLSNGYVDVIETEISFTATNLVPFAVDPPVLIDSWNTDNRTILIEFDKNIMNIAAQTGFAITALEPNMSPEGVNSLATHTVESVAYNDPENKKVIKITLTYAGRMKHPQGDVTINFTGSLDGGFGAMVEPFIDTFTPSNLTLFFKPNDPERLQISNVTITNSVVTELFRYNYQLLELEYLTIAGATILSSVLTHIDDLEQ